MIDKSQRDPEKQSTANDGNTAETPTLLESHSASTNKQKASKYAQTAKDYVSTAFECALDLICWLNRWVWKVLRSTDFWMASATVAIAISTGIYTYYARKQWTAMNGQLDEMRKATVAAQDAANAAKRAADIADTSLKATQQQFRSEQRPFYVPDGPPMFAQSLLQNPLAQTNITFHNIGHSPAFDAVDFSRMSKIVFTRRVTEKEFAAMLDREFDKVSSSLKFIDDPTRTLEKSDFAPGVSHFTTAELPQPLSTAEMSDVISSKINLVYVGVAVYKGFNGAEKYSTEFCFYFFGKDPSIWHICPVHNTIR